MAPASGLKEYKRKWTFGKLTLVVTEGERLDLLCDELTKEFPGLVMQYKSRHWYWRLLHWVVLIVTFGGNKVFKQNYTTTFRRMIGWSEKYEKRIESREHGWEDRIWSCLMHEREHLRQFERWGMFLMTLLYVFVFFPVGLAYCRARLELAGYRQTLRCWYQLDPSWALSSKGRDWWVSRFTGGAYAWMWPFKKMVERWYDKILTECLREAA